MFGERDPLQLGYSQYDEVTYAVVQRLQQAHDAGEDLGAVVPGMDRERAEVIVAETRVVDRLVAMLEKGRLDVLMDPRRPVPDLAHASFADMMLELDRTAYADAPSSFPEEDPEDDYRLMRLAHLMEALDSRTASPMLWYEGMYTHAAQLILWREEPGSLPAAVILLERGLAHNLAYNEGNNAMQLLRDIADATIAIGEVDEGLRIYAGLLRYRPDEIWVPNAMAISFHRYGLIELGIAAVERALALAAATGDPEELTDQLERARDMLAGSEERGREAEVAPSVLAEVHAALEVPFDAVDERSDAEIAHELVPSLDGVVVKRPLTLDDLAFVPPPELRPGRNEPCWCGSGRKYKHCHARADREADLAARRW